MATYGSSTLIAALAADNRWVRVGAALALAGRHAREAIPALEALADAAHPGTDELWLCLHALDRLGVDPRQRAARAAGFDSVAGLVYHLSLDAYQLGHQTLGELPAVARRFLAELHRREARGGFDSDAPEAARGEPADSWEMAARQLAGAQQMLRALYTNAHGDAEAARLAPIIAALRSSAAADRATGLRDLVVLGLTHPDAPLREYVAPALATLHDCGTARTLLEAIVDSPPCCPSKEALTAMRREAGALDDDRNDERDGYEMAKCLAASLLERFDDADTAWRLCRIGVQASTGTRARALEILTGMSVEASVPAAVWACLTAMAAVERTRASELLAGLIEGTGEGLGDTRRIGEDRYLVDLRWIGELVEDAQRAPAWAAAYGPDGPLAFLRDRRLTQELIGQAITAVTLERLPATIVFSKSSTWTAFEHHGLRIRERYAGLVPADPILSPGTARPTSRPYGVAARFPSICALGSADTLDVEVRLRDGDTTPGDFTLEFMDGAAADLLVLVRAAAFDVEPAWRKLSVHPSAAVVRAAFSLRARQRGTHVIEVDIIRNADRLAQLRLSTAVKRFRMPWQSGRADTAGTVDADRVVAPACLRAVIVADWDPQTGLSLDLIDGAAPEAELEPMGTTLAGLSLQDISTWSSRNLSQLQELAEYDYQSAEAAETGMARIRGQGKDIFDQVVPGALAARIATWPRGVAIGIDTNEHWVPWELLTPNADVAVLGDFYDIVRLPRAAVDAAGAPASPGTFGGTPAPEVRQIASVVGDRLPLWDGQPVHVFPAGLAVQLAKEPSIGALKALAATVDVLHLTCHGRVDPASQIQYLSLGLDLFQRLQPADVATFKLKPGAMVFANACSSERPTLSLQHFVGFAGQFYHRGARPFIGTLATVPTPQAYEFASSFYDALLTDGVSAVRALRQAKESARARHHNPFWLFYCLYGTGTEARRVPLTR